MNNTARKTLVEGDYCHFFMEHNDMREPLREFLKFPEVLEKFWLGQTFVLTISRCTYSSGGRVIVLDHVDLYAFLEEAKSAP